MSVAHSEPADYSLQAKAALTVPYQSKPRVFVLSDIGNEPDDQMSLTRFLLYSNEMTIEGLVATTSTWQKKKGQPGHDGAGCGTLCRGAA
ncbi:DUF1593 domain-containing protein [Pantoea tagorei]